MPNMNIKNKTGRANLINHFDCEENDEVTKRCKLYLTHKSGAVGHAKWSSYYFDKNTDIEITDPWKMAIRMTAKRIMVIPADIVIDFMVVNGLWEEE